MNKQLQPAEVAKIRAAAEKFIFKGQGDWFARKTCKEKDFHAILIKGSGGGTMWSKEPADFIALTNPTTILAMCDALEAKDEDVFQSRAWVEAWADRIVEAEAENKRLRDLLFMANGQLKFIGCFANCDNGVMRDGNGIISQCQCCHEQEQIEESLKQ